MSALTELLTTHGISNATALVAAAARSGCPLHVVLGDVEIESYGGRNVYGHDPGGVFSTVPDGCTVAGVWYPPGAIVPVTPGDAPEFVRRVRAGEKSNGLGPSQITARDFIDDLVAEGLDPANPEHTSYVGYRHMAALLHQHGGDVVLAGTVYRWGALTKLDGTPTDRTYGQDLARRADTWKGRLTALDTARAPVPPLTSPAPQRPAPSPTTRRRKRRR